MLHPDSFSPQPLPSDESTSGHTAPFRAHNYWLALILTFVGASLVIVAFFSPWIEVFKIAPGFSPAKHAYSPLMVLQRGPIDATSVVVLVVVALFLVILGLMVTAFALARTGKATLRVHVDHIVVVSIALALVGLFAVITALGSARLILSLDSPYYDTNIVYGSWLAIAGFLIVGVSCASLLLRRGLPDFDAMVMM